MERRELGPLLHLLLLLLLASLTRPIHPAPQASTGAVRMILSILLEVIMGLLLYLTDVRRSILARQEVGGRLMISMKRVCQTVLVALIHLFHALPGPCLLMSCPPELLMDLPALLGLPLTVLDPPEVSSGALPALMILPEVPV